jgi:hypothetical protein
MVDDYVGLEGIAHDETLDLPSRDWRRSMDLARFYGWEPPEVRWWSHFYAPIGEPEPVPPEAARGMADALEGALASQCSHDQFRPDPQTPAELRKWCATAQGK